MLTANLFPQALAFVPFNILVATDLTEQSMTLLRAAEGVEVYTVAPKTAAVRAGLKTAHALIARDEVALDAELLNNRDATPCLQVITRVVTSVPSGRAT